MCGIVGVFALDRRPIDRTLLSAMTDRLRHRGPDDAGLWTAPGIGLGHRRLAIRDLSPDGHQPMSDSGGRITISYNGELYNDRALRGELERDFGFCFRSTCDAEVIPYGYLAWGERLFERLEGMFAIALWDARDQTLVLARDSIGIKPLFYSWTDGLLRFASELKALLADPGQPRAIDAENLHRFVNQGYAGPTQTLLRDTQQVPPGSLMTVTASGIKVRKYWTYSRTSEIRSLGDAVDAFVPLWNQVVSETLISDVPVGVLQSGGIDSSLVACAARRATERLPLFTVSFDDASRDESAMAAVVAKTTGLPHTFVPFGRDPTPEDTLDAVIAHSDGQLADESLMPLYLLSEQVRRHVKVVLTGDGGDELFGGYPTYRASMAAAVLRPLVPRALAQAAGRFAYGLSPAAERHLPASAVASRFMLGLALGGRAAHAHWRRYMPQFLHARLYGAELRSLSASPFADYEAVVLSAGGSIVDAALLADQTYHLPAGLLFKTDSMTMAHGLEARVPLLDRRIIEFAARCHPSLLTGWTGRSKRVLRAALARYAVPAEVVNAPKRGFNTPLASLLRTSLRARADRVFRQQNEVFEPFFDPGEIAKLWLDHAERRADHAYALWPMLTFGIWRATLEAGLTT